MTRIMFVDDEPAVLAGLQNLFYRDRKRWDLVFAPGGEAALDEIHKAPFDIVVSDMRMPGVDGAMLLNRIKDECPTTIRIMLSGQANRDLIAKVIPVLHRLLGKPCEAKTLRGTLERSLDGADVERDVRIRRIAAGVDRLPTPPDIFFDLTRLMQSPITSITDIADVVCRDPGLSAKVLQLVNSAYFSGGKVTASIQRAVAQLGIEQLRYFALTASVFSPQPDNACWFPVQDFRRGALRMAYVARQIAEPALRDEAFAATLLHDIGHLVIALTRGPEFQLFQDEARRIPTELDLELELRLLGITHAEVGARLLAIWGLPYTIVDAVQFHHNPGDAPEESRRLASIVHVADTVVQHLPVRSQLNMASLERAGCAHLAAGWLAAAQLADSVAPNL